MEPPQIPAATVRVFELYAPIDGPVPGSLADWPANIQDAVGRAVERLAKMHGIPVALVESWCEKNYDVPDTNLNGYVWCIRGIVSEVVVGKPGMKDTRGKVKM